MTAGSEQLKLAGLVCLLVPTAALAHPGHGSLHTQFLGLDPVAGLALMGLGFCSVMLGAYVLAPRIARLARRLADKLRGA